MKIIDNYIPKYISYFLGVQISLNEFKNYTCKAVGDEKLNKCLSIYCFKTNNVLIHLWSSLF